MKQINIHLPEVDHRRLRVELAMLGLTLHDFFRRAVCLFLSSPQTFMEQTPDAEPEKTDHP